MRISLVLCGHHLRGMPFTGLGVWKFLISSFIRPLGQFVTLNATVLDAMVEAALAKVVPEA
jgi:hypothetical protein